MTAALTLASLNRMPANAFVEALGEIFEASPWVARAATLKRPYSRLEQLHEVMCAVVRDAGEAAQLGLIRAHPELAVTAASDVTLSPASRNEQRGAGLEQASNDEADQLRRLNQIYLRQHGFPFIIAVAGLDRTAILAALRQRLERSTELEQAEALRQIERIAWLRLVALID